MQMEILWRRTLLLELNYANPKRTAKKWNANAPAGDAGLN